MEQCAEADGVIISITEWPVDQEIPEPDNTQRTNRPTSSYQRQHKKTKWHDVETRDALCLTYNSKQAKMTSEEMKLRPSGEIEEPLVQARVARWWRRNSEKVEDRITASTNNPNTKLFLVSRTKRCRDFLNDERKNLLAKIENKFYRKSAHDFAAIASIEDWLEQYESAGKRIDEAVCLKPCNGEYKWLQEKLSKQCRMLILQREALTGIHTIPNKFPQAAEVERVSAKNVSLQDFLKYYVHKGQPIILLDVVKRMTDVSWTLEFVKDVAGQQQVTIKKVVPQSVEWARLEESHDTTVAEFINAVQNQQTEGYLFDWSLPIHCPELSAMIKIPQYFSGNYLQKTSEGSLYHDSWPSLFIAPAGVVSNLHIDAFASNFWMALFQGQKRWTFFPQEDVPYLYPTFFHSMDPVFSVDLCKPNLEQHPLLSITHPKQCILQPGELLFVPGGSPHFVENLTASLAISSNHVDSSNYNKVCEELRINGLLDPRAANLLQQLEQDKFMKANNLL